MFTLIWNFLKTPEGMAAVAAAGSAIYGWLFKKKLDARWAFIISQAPRVFLSVETLIPGVSNDGGAAKRSTFVTRMNELLKAWNYKALEAKDVEKLTAWVREEATSQKTAKANLARFLK